MQFTSNRASIRMCIFIFVRCLRSHRSMRICVIISKVILLSNIIPIITIIFYILFFNRQIGSFSANFSRFREVSKCEF